MKLDLTVDEVLTTTRSVRRRLDLDRPVERRVIEECVEIAMQTPSGSNRQGWHWVFVEDAAKKLALAECYRRQFDATYRQMAPAVHADPDAQARADRVRSSATWLADNFERVPLILVPCHPGKIGGAPLGAQAGWWGSLLPAVWSFMLALRSRGLGSAWVTMNLARPEGEQEVADVLGIPVEDYSQAGMFPIAHTVGTDFRPVPTPPVAERVHWDNW